MSRESDLPDALVKLKHGFQNGKLGQAYLVVGDPRGNAARLAEFVLQMIFCNSGDPPCGACNNCRRAAGRIHPDAAWIEPVRKSRGILVEQVREIIRNTFETTLEGGWKAVVLVNAERMNSEAANKLLKTLEEPPPRTVFLLLTDQPEALLPTIISRCRKLVLSDSAANPESELHSAVAGIALGLKGGRMSPRLALAREMTALLKEIREKIENEEEEQMRLAQVDGEQAGDLEKVSEGRIEALYREKRRAVLRLLQLWQRDLLVCASGLGGGGILHFAGEEQQVRAMACGLSPAQLMKNIGIIENMQAQLDQHLPESMVIERAFLRLAAPSGAGSGEAGRREAHATSAYS